MKLYRCDNPKCTNVARKYKGKTLRSSYICQADNTRRHDTFHFCGARCLVEFMHGTEWLPSNDPYVRDGIHWHGRRPPDE